MDRTRQKIQNILRGMGSVFDICPATDYRRFVPRKTGPERMRGHFESVGRAIERSISRVAGGQGTK
jgi:hypothetical protein